MSVLSGATRSSPSAWEIRIGTAIRLAGLNPSTCARYRSQASFRASSPCRVRKMPFGLWMAASGARSVQSRSRLSSARALVSWSASYFARAQPWKIRSLSMPGSPPNTPLVNSA